MLEFAAKHRISVKTNLYHGLKEIPRLVEDAHTGKMQGKAVVIVDETLLYTESPPSTDSLTILEGGDIK